MCLDRNNIQVMSHFCLYDIEKFNPQLRDMASAAKNMRLSTFLSAAENAGISECLLSSGKQNQFSNLYKQEIKLVCVLTRSVESPFSLQEIEDLVAFISTGGALLLMSNHPPFSDIDTKLAECFQVRLHGIYNSRGFQTGKYAHIPFVDLPEHKLAEGIADGIYFNNCCNVEPMGIEVDAFVPLPKEPDYYGDHANGVFAIIKSCIGQGGRIFICGDSGFIGAKGTMFPGPGMMNLGDKNLFLANVLQWLVLT